jgi:hypothetical protein
MSNYEFFSTHEGVLSALELRYKSFDIIEVYPRKIFDGFTRVYIRVRGENSPRNVRVYDGGLVEEIPSNYFENSREN